MLVLVVRRDRTALARRDLLVRVEREDGRMAVRTDWVSLVPGAECLARILDEREAVSLAELAQRIELARIAEDVHGHDRLCALGDRGCDGGRIEVVRARVDVGEHRHRTLVDRTVRGGDERERGGDHLVAGTDAGEPHRQVQAGSAARDPSTVLGADGLREQLLEPWPGRAEREPPRAQRLEHELLVALVDPRRRQCDRARGLRHAWARAKFSTGSRQCAQRSVSPLPFTVSR